MQEDTSAIPGRSCIPPLLVWPPAISSICLLDQGCVLPRCTPRQQRAPTCRVDLRLRHFVPPWALCPRAQRYRERKAWTSLGNRRSFPYPPHENENGKQQKEIKEKKEKGNCVC